MLACYSDECVLCARFLSVVELFHYFYHPSRYSRQKLLSLAHGWIIAVGADNVGNGGTGKVKVFRLSTGGKQCAFRWCNCCTSVVVCTGVRVCASAFVCASHRDDDYIRRSSVGIFAELLVCRKSNGVIANTVCNVSAFATGETGSGSGMCLCMCVCTRKEQ